MCNLPFWVGWMQWLQPILSSCMTARCAPQTHCFMLICGCFPPLPPFPGALPVPPHGSQLPKSAGRVLPRHPHQQELPDGRCWGSLLSSTQCIPRKLALPLAPAALLTPTSTSVCIWFQNMHFLGVPRCDADSREAEAWVLAATSLRLGAIGFPSLVLGCREIGETFSKANIFLYPGATMCLCLFLPWPCV